MLGSGWLVLGQNVLSLILAFASMSLFGVFRDKEKPHKHKVLLTLVVIVVAVLWLSVTAYQVRTANARQAEEEWVRSRSDWMVGQIERLIGDARGIRYPMLTLSESDLPKKRKLAALRSVYVPCVNRYRDGAVQLLRDELPGTHADIFDYDFGFGEGTTRWNMAILNGVVVQLIAVSTNMETLVSRSTVPRTHRPDAPYKVRVWSNIRCS